MKLLAILAVVGNGILRQWLDSFDYTVKQQIVGSLLFTPLLLLLPTTSFFYIFFSIVDTTINLVCPLIEVTTISVIHVTPYTKIFLWLVRPGRFPSGIWLEIIGCQSNSTASPSADFTDEITSYKESLHLKDFNREKSSSLVSALHSNYLSIGKMISPHYKHVFWEFLGHPSPQWLMEYSLDKASFYLHQCHGRPCTTKRVLAPLS
ncbi:hypothetical protein AAZX31_19G120700 [Glycine max]